MAEKWNNPNIRTAWLEAIDHMRFFSEIPVISEMRTSWEGRIWVRRQDMVGRGDGTAIDILTADGKYLGTYGKEDGVIRGIPDAFGPKGMAAFVEIDELGVESIVVRRLHPLLR